MCWSAEVSLITFITSITMCIYIWYRNGNNDRALALWIGAFSLMQLFEFFMWINMKDHSFVSKLSLVFILAQPLILASALLLIGNINDDNTLISKKWLKWILGIVIGISLIKVIYTIYYSFWKEYNSQWLSVKGENCHLVWYFIKNQNDMPFLTRINNFYFIPLFITCLLIKPFNLGLVYALFGFISFNWSAYYYGLEYGSLWCWIANALALFTILKPTIGL